MEKEFNLSEKSISVGTISKGFEVYYPLRHVKEFIKRLKDNLKLGLIITKIELEKIDKLAGDKLK